MAVEIGLLDVDLRRVLRGAVIEEIGGDVGRPDIVEFVIDADIEAFDVEADALLGGHRRAVGLLLVLTRVEIHAAADLGVLPPGALFGGAGFIDLILQRFDLGLRLLIGL